MRLHVVSSAFVSDNHRLATLGPKAPLLTTSTKKLHLMCTLINFNAADQEMSYYQTAMTHTKRGI